MKPPIPKQPRPQVVYESGKKMWTPTCPKCKQYPGQLKRLGDLYAGKCQHCMNAVVVKET